MPQIFKIKSLPECFTIRMRINKVLLAETGQYRMIWRLEGSDGRDYVGCQNLDASINQQRSCKDACRKLESNSPTLVEKADLDIQRSTRSVKGHRKNII